MINRAILALACCVFAASAAAQVPATDMRLVDEQFSSLDTGAWCPCQISLTGDSRLHFPEEGGSIFARIPVSPADIGGNKCRWDDECAPLLAKTASLFHSAEVGREEPDAVERLGPSLISPPPANMVTMPPSSEAAAEAVPPAPYPEGGPHCSEEKKAEGLAKLEDVDTPCAQRQELRLLDGETHGFSVPLLYSFRFRMEKEVPDEEQSIRWVTAQWKQEPAVQPGEPIDGVEWGPGPFLSQRFDDGVLHVAVQDQECRCLVASADHPKNPQWAKKPERCYSVALGAGEREECPADLEAVYGDDPLLPTARGEWVTLRYLVKPGRSGTGMVKVFDDQRLVVTVTGSIGYNERPDESSYVKFKIGQYNDYMPKPHLMDVDWLTIDTLKQP
jgi:hypothetical protein